MLTTEVNYVFSTNITRFCIETEKKLHRSFKVINPFTKPPNNYIHFSRSCMNVNLAGLVQPLLAGEAVAESGGRVVSSEESSLLESSLLESSSESLKSFSDDSAYSTLGVQHHFFTMGLLILRGFTLARTQISLGISTHSSAGFKLKEKSFQPNF